jgi:type IV pilus assembly protein PilM
MTKFLDYFPPPRFLELPYIGINIGPRAVRFIEILRAKHGFKVGRFAEKALPPGNPALTLRENKSLAKALRDLKEEFDLKFVEAALPEEKAYLFKMQIPNESDQRIRNFIEFHLEENVPLSLEESVFDYHLIDTDRSTESNTEATISVLPAKAINEYIEVFDKAGLVPVSFLIESQAIAKAVIKKGDNDTYLIVNIGENKTVLSVISDQAVEFTSTVMVGSEDFTAALVKQFNLTPEEARKKKWENGFIKDNSDLFFALISTASALKDEIERVYIYWHTHFEDQKKVRSKIIKILLVGKEAALRGFKEYISESVRVEAEIANVWTNAFSFNDYIPPIEASDALNYGAAIGLALPKL